MTYINVNKTQCFWDEKCCWSCANYKKGWSYPDCGICLERRKKLGKYNNWTPRMFDRKKLEEAAIDCMMT